MTLKALAKSDPPRRVLGIDISTNTVAFCMFEAAAPVWWGEVEFKGKDSMERVMDLGPKVRAVNSMLSYDSIAMESIVYVNNRATVINLAYAAGAVLSSLNKVPVKTYNPIEWQSFIGNKALTKAEKDNIKSNTPGKTETWYKGANREFRKQRTKDWVLNTYGLKIESDNVTDAFGVAFKGWHDSRG